jgi:hypothetical protein
LAPTNQRQAAFLFGVGWVRTVCLCQHALARAAAADPEADPAVDSVSAAAGDIIDGEGLAGANRAANANLNAPAATSVAIALVHAKVCVNGQPSYFHLHPGCLFHFFSFIRV